MKIKKLPVIVADGRNFDKRFFMIGRREKIESDKPIILSSVRDRNVFNAEPPRVLQILKKPHPIHANFSDVSLIFLGVSAFQFVLSQTDVILKAV
jgi:hypothetical protein